MQKNLPKQKYSARTLTGLAVLTALVIVLQAVGSSIHFGIFSITLVLAPIIIGAALYGKAAGAWLGLVFGIVVLLTDSAAFWVINPIGTIVICLAKGCCAGLAAAIVYRLLEGLSKTAAVICAGIICPVVNTGLFLLGCILFFKPTLVEWSQGYDSIWIFMLTAFVGVNFFIELGINLILSTGIVRVLEIIRQPTAHTENKEITETDPEKEDV